MPAVQTSYSPYHAPATVGMIVNMEPHTIISRVVEGATPIAFGSVVVQGAGDQGVLPSKAGGVFRGISVLSTVEPAYLTAYTVDTYLPQSIAAVMTKGVVYVASAGNVSAGQPAFFNAASGAISADNTGVAINGVFDSSGAAGALVKLRLV